MLQKFKSAENKVQQHAETIEAMKQEMEKMRLMVFEATDKLKKAQNEADTAKAQYVDIERTERTVRVDLEQVSKKVELQMKSDVTGSDQSWLALCKTFWYYNFSSFCLLIWS